MRSSCTRRCGIPSDSSLCSSLASARRTGATTMHAGAPFSSLGTNLTRTCPFSSIDPEAFDCLWRSAGEALYTTSSTTFCASFSPDIVHFQHSHFFGYD